MPNLVTIKRSNVANKQPTAADLAVGELAVNFPDRRLYTKDPANAIVSITGDSWNGDITDINLVGGADIGADLTDTDLILVNNRKSVVSRIWTYVYTKIAALTDISSWASVLDEDDMASDSATRVPTQQSVKAYVDTKTDRPVWKTLTGTLSVPLDGGYYEYQIPAGSNETLAYTLPANDASTKQYDALLKVTSPAAGTETITIPSGWGKLGPLDAISLTAGDQPIFIVLSTDNDSDTAPTVNFTAQQRELMP